MSICLCNLTADTILEQLAKKKREIEPASPDPRNFVADVETAWDNLASQEDSLPNPVELLVCTPQNRRSSEGLTCHMWNGALPRNSVYLIDEGIYVTSPEFTLLMQATQLHQASLCMMLGRYLGTWTPDPHAELGQRTRAPLTSLEQLQSFLTGVDHARGKGNLKFAMAYTCENSASAPEAALQLALSLPPELHGLALPQPIMNYELGLSSRARKLYDHENIRIDLCWHEKKFGLEYQGQEHGKSLGEDYARWFAAREEDYELWFMAKEQLASAAQMSHIGHEVAERLGVGEDDRLWPTESELQDLLDILNGRRHPKPVSYREMRKRHKSALKLLRAS